MARGGNVLLDIDFSRVFQNLEMVVDHVGRGTKKATLEMVKEIYEQSQKEVPRETQALARSGYYRVDGNYRTGFTGVVGYGGNGNPVNPKTGQRASTYMIAVHEDLHARHPVGKAKFLEDPIQEYHAKVGAKARQFIKMETGI